MKIQFTKVAVLFCLLTLGACEALDDFLGNTGDDGKVLRYIDEFVLPDGLQFENTVVGGLSGIDYANGVWYMISDDPNTARCYTATLTYDDEEFSTVDIQSIVELKDQGGDAFATGTVDPEALRVFGGNIVWTSEGNVNNSIDPFVRRATLGGDFINEIQLAERYSVTDEDGRGPRQNGVFEGISLSTDGRGFWVNMELPLVQDGPAPTLQDTDSPIRIAYIDKATGQFGREFAYELDPVVRPAANGTSFELNGVVELLEYAEDKFLVLERSFSTGYDDGGNTVKIYDVDATTATDISGVEALVGTDYEPAKKVLLFDFEEIREQLTDGVVDNIEGIAFGPDLSNGNRSLVLVADNNFSAFGPQLNQFVVFELVE